MNIESVLKQIKDAISNNNIDSYYPQQHSGNCINEYVVVKYSGAVKIEGVSSDMPTYAIMCYVPSVRYGDLMPLLEKVKIALREIYPLVEPSGNETPSFYDDITKSHMISLEYIGHRKVELWR